MVGNKKQQRFCPGMGWFLLILLVEALPKTESWISGAYRINVEASWVPAVAPHRVYRAAPSRTGTRSSTPACSRTRRDDRPKVTLFASNNDNTGLEVALMEMDVVVYSEMADDRGKRKLGAVQQDGRITPLSAWTDEPAFDSYVELLVDEEDLLPGYRVEDGSIRIHAVVPENLLSYGSRQVNGGMGPGNPHGEESEMLYYIHKSIVDDVEVEVKPNLEVFW
jgi:hypothetical protein